MNWEKNLEVIKRVLEIANLVGAEKILDLYCGIGNFSLPLALKGFNVTGVEYGVASVKAAKKAAAHLGLGNNTLFLTSDVERFIQHNCGKERWDLLILDPPRKGAKEVVGRVSKLNIPHIIYISCNPATLARDLNILKKQGYEIESIEAYDFFPQTVHIETLVLLVKTDKK